MILIQQIVTEWSRASRGGAGARARSGVPKILPVPPELLGAGSVIEHAVVFEEVRGFEARLLRAAARTAVPERLECVHFRAHGEEVDVLYQWEEGCGAPRRDLQPPRALFTIGVGEFGRVIHNGRFADESAWRYRQVVVNVCSGEAVFVATMQEREPSRVADLRERLW